VGMAAGWVGVAAGAGGGVGADRGAGAATGLGAVASGGSADPEQAATSSKDARTAQRSSDMGDKGRPGRAKSTRGKVQPDLPGMARLSIIRAAAEPWLRGACSRAAPNLDEAASSTTGA
jgi:hypothetical protein